MQFLLTSKNMTLSSLADRIGERNVDDMLNVNGLSRTVNIGAQFYGRTPPSIPEIDAQTKISILNTLVGNSDIYERAALGSEQDWWCLSTFGCFSDALRVPETTQLPPAVDVFGNQIPIAYSVYMQCVNWLTAYNRIDPSIFYNSVSGGAITFGIVNQNTEAGKPGEGSRISQAFQNSKTKISPFQNFRIHTGQISLYSSLTKTSMEIPVYPEDLNDSRSATFTEMPSLLYQYEPWYVYQNSGPRKQNITFKLHRDLWTGDHEDGSANRLIRFCEANCYPDYDGSAVNCSRVTLFIGGQEYISGIMTNCDVHWYGPIGQDKFYLAFDLTLGITEVSAEPLNFNTVRKKGLIG